MTAAEVPKLLPMEETPKDMWKRRLRFVIEMTSGVVYSIVMHSVIITAYAFFIFQIFYPEGFDLDKFGYVCAPIIITYLPVGIAEVVGRRFYSDEEPLTVTKIGHFAHFYGCMMLLSYMYPSNPIEGLVFFFVGTTLVCWTCFVLLAFAILAYLEDGHLTEPLV